LISESIVLYCTSPRLISREALDDERLAAIVCPTPSPFSHDANLMRTLANDRDILAVCGLDFPQHNQPTVHIAISLLSDDIASFRDSSGCERPIVIYLGSPARPATPPLADVTSWSELMARPADGVPAGTLYAAAAVQSSADFIDFTPSESLDCLALWARSRMAEMQLAGPGRKHR
jgi:hypothetical protein